MGLEGMGMRTGTGAHTNRVQVGNKMEMQKMTVEQSKKH